MRSVTANRYFPTVSEKIGYGPDGLPLLDSITWVDENEKGAVETDAWEEPYYGSDNLCKYRDAMSDRAVEKLEAEYDDANDRINNIGLADNGEAEVLDNFLTNI